MAEAMDRFRPGGNPRGEDTRRRILNTALPMFATLGFEGTSTRALAEHAGVNLPAIQYYFGSKEGLYRAVIGEITSFIEAQVGPIAGRIGAMLDRGEPGRAELMDLLFEMTDVLVAMILDQTLTDRDTCRRFFARVEIEHTEAIETLHALVDKVMLAPCAALIGRLMGLPADDVRVRMQMVAFLGQAKAFGAWGCDRVLGWNTVGTAQVHAVQALLREHAAAIFHDPRAAVP
jgi:AcrR family transcriptional regulator